MNSTAIYCVNLILLTLIAASFLLVIPLVKLIENVCKFAPQKFWHVLRKIDLEVDYEIATHLMISWIWQSFRFNAFDVITTKDFNDVT